MKEKSFQTVSEAKEYFMDLLTKTDYSQLPDTGIANKEDFVNFRKLVRRHYVRAVYFTPEYGYTFDEDLLLSYLPEPLWYGGCNTTDPTMDPFLNTPLEERPPDARPLIEL